MNPHAANIINLYQRHGETWSKARGTHLLESAWLDCFRALLPPGGTVLDLGCGSGDPIARYLVQHGHVITGIDSSPGMIAACAAKFPTHTWHVADMRTLALSRSFNGIVAWDSFFHLCPTDQRAMFPIFRAHAAPGAALMFTSGPTDGEAMGILEGEPLYHASLSPEEYRSLFASHDFTVVTHIAEDPACTGHTVWLARSFD